MSSTGRVITRFGSESLIESATGEVFRCTTRRKLEHIACGDYVEWEANEQGNATILRLLPRQNVLSRPDFRGKLKAIAANIDLLIIVISWRPSPLWEMLDRYLIAASMLPSEALIVVNKADLAKTYARDTDFLALQDYQQAGYTVITTNTLNQQGIDDLQEQIGHRTAILAGQSGVGKSSLIMCLLPNQDIRVGSIADTGEGRHTTTSASLYHLPSGGVLIDSPGVRDFSLPPISVHNLQNAYIEFTPYLGKCRFHNCIHQYEPNCAIRQAVETKQLSSLRYGHYLSILKTL